MGGTRARCPCPAVRCPAQAQVLAPATDPDPVPAPVHARVLACVKPQTLTQAYVKPSVLVRDQATSRASVKGPGHVMAKVLDLVLVQAQDHAQALTKDPPFPHCLTVCSLKGRHSHLSLMLLTPPPQAFLPSLTSSVLCRSIQQECCWSATAAWPISSSSRPSRQ